MLNTEQVRRLCDELHLGAEARAIVNAVRGMPPSRPVNQSAGNVSARFPSRKMGWTIQAESHRVELAAIHEMEYAADVLEYYDQPSAIPLRYRAQSGRTVAVQHTPDFFVIRRDWIGWEEWKTEPRLKELARQMPGRYVFEDRDESGTVGAGGMGVWRCPPGEAYGRQVGLNYRVRSDAEINWVMQRNIQFMADYWRADVSPIDVPTMRHVHDCFALQQAKPTQQAKGKGGNDDVVGDSMMLVELLQNAGEDGIGADVIYTLIAHGRLWVDLHAAPLAEPERVIVRWVEAVETRETRVTDVKAGISIQNKTRPDATRTHTQTSTSASISSKLLTELTPEGRKVLEEADTKALTVANERWAILRRAVGQGSRGLHGLSHGSNHTHDDDADAMTTKTDKPPGTPMRTLFHWQRRYREAEQQYGSGYVGLLPHHNRKGNRSRKLPPQVVALMDQVAADTYETAKRRNVQSVYGTLVNVCQQQNWVAPSYKTFLEAIKKRPRVHQLEKREGKRSAYAATAFYWELNLTTPRHGDRPFEIGHIDHTELDIELVCSITGRPLGRPWLTLLVDAFTRRILALWLSYDRPSYRACMMVLRECVRRHHRLPQTIVVDGGKEFESIYFETLLARYECTKKTRPSAQPRFGSVCERLFGVTNTLFIHNLAGNTQNSKEPRRNSRSHDPKRQARWTLPKLFEYVQQWAYEVYDTRDHPSLGQSPRAAFERGQKTAGVRAHRTIAYDNDFITLTMPTTRKGTARVHMGHGVTINHIDYWCDAFRDSSVIGQAVPIRYDPFDAGVAYAYVQGGWKRCISDHYAQLRGRSVHEVALITEELHRRNQRKASTAHSQVTSAQIARFVAAAEEQEEILAQRLRDAEARHIMRALHMQDDPVNPVSVSAMSPPTPTGGITSGAESHPHPHQQRQHGRQRRHRHVVYTDF